MQRSYSPALELSRVGQRGLDLGDSLAFPLHNAHRARGRVRRILHLADKKKRIVAHLYIHIKQFLPAHFVNGALIQKSIVVVCKGGTLQVRIHTEYV